VADLFQGQPLPSLKTQEQKQTIAPQYLTDYQQDIINLGKNAVQQGGVAGLSPLTQQALNMAPQMTQAGAGSTGTAQDLLTQSGYTGANQIVQNYMNPYTKNVVDEMSRLSQRDIRDNVMPMFDTASIGSGNFGGSRAGMMKGQTLADIQSDLLGKQFGALNTGYNQAMGYAQGDLSRGVQAGQALNQTAQVQNQIGSGALKQMADLGSIEQKQQQNQLDYPMAQAKDFATLMQGQNVPTGSSQTTIAPGEANKYGLSPLEQMVSLAALYKSFTDPNASVPFISDKLPTTVTGKAQGGSVFQDQQMIPEGAVFYDEDGNFYDTEGNVLG
jgi:hypothetical protein